MSSFWSFRGGEAREKRERLGCLGQLLNKRHRHPSPHAALLSWHFERRGNVSRQTSLGAGASSIYLYLLGVSSGEPQRKIPCRLTHSPHTDWASTLHSHDMTPLQQYTADHRYLLEAVSTAAGIDDPIAVQLDAFHHPLLTKATRGAIVPIDGMMIRDWDPDHRKTWPGVKFGAREYMIEGIRFARCYCTFDTDIYDYGYDFVAVSRKDYLRSLSAGGDGTA